LDLSAAAPCQRRCQPCRRPQELTPAEASAGQPGQGSHPLPWPSL